MEFHREFEQSVNEHLSSNYDGTDGYDIWPVIGGFRATLQSRVMTFANTLDMLEERAGKDEGGDGTVPRLSSVPEEIFSTMRNVTFAAHRHSPLQNADPVLTQVHGLLRGAAPDPGTVGLEQVAAGRGYRLGYLSGLNQVHSRGTGQFDRTYLKPTRRRQRTPESDRPAPPQDARPNPARSHRFHTSRRTPREAWR